MDYQTIEATCSENIQEWGYLNKGKYSDECWKIQFTGPGACEHCNHQDDTDRCTGLFIRHTMHNQWGHRIPFRRPEFPDSMLPGMPEWIKTRQEGKDETIAIQIMIDEGIRRMRLIEAEVAEPVFQCEHCSGEFWFMSMFTACILSNPEDKDPDVNEFCSDNCRMDHEEDSQWCDACSQQISLDHFVYNENIGDPVCNSCVKDEFINGNLLSDFIDNDKIPPDFCIVAPDEFKRIKVFDETPVTGPTSLDWLCHVIRNLQKKGKVLILRPDGSNSDERGDVEIFIKPFSKNRLRKARKYDRAI